MNKYQQLNQEILEFKRNLGSNSYFLGRKLLEMRDTKLYLQHHPTFTAYLRDAVDLSERSAFRFISMAENFEQEQIEQWGVSKLDYVAQLEKPKQQEFLNSHSPGTPLTEIKEQVKRWQPQEYVPRDPSVEFFTITEMKLQQLIALVRETKDHLGSCSMNQAFNTYPRRAIVMSLWQTVQNECK